MRTSKAPVFFLLLSALIISIAPWPSARAQPGNTAAASAAHVPIAIPVEASPGWDQKQWAGIRQECQDIADKSHAHIPLNTAEFEISETCFAISPHPTPEPQILNGHWSGGKNGNSAGKPAPTPQVTATPS